MTILTTSIQDAAKATGLSQDTVRRRIKTGELRASRGGRRVLVNFESLAKLVSTCADKRRGKEKSA